MFVLSTLSLFFSLEWDSLHGKGVCITNGDRKARPLSMVCYGWVC